MSDDERPAGSDDDADDQDYEDSGEEELEPTPEPKKVSLTTIIVGVALVVVVFAVIVAFFIHAVGSSHGSGQNAAQDVRVAQTITFTSSGLAQVQVSVTNSTPDTSNYLINLSVTNASGKSLLDTATANVENVDPGQTSRQQVPLYSITKDNVQGAKVAITNVLRTPSS
ncbi:MAG TPA: hypothetical protein VMI11_02160 [Actinomycetes bacterium]|nr:hypothetical protein [Actinomycetes bacterium]